MLADLAKDSKGLTGIIRVSAPVTFGEAYVAGMLGRFASLNPTITIDLRLNDRFVDLATDGIDVAFRIGTTDTLSIKTHKLGAVQSCVAASPGYLARHGTPETPGALREHACILDTNRRNSSGWPFRDGNTALSINVVGRFRVNSARAAVELAMLDQGVIYAPRFALSDALKSGRLVTLLDAFTSEPNPVSAVYLEGRALPRKVRALIDFAHEDIKSAGLA